jgi:hypothetical protein
MNQHSTVGTPYGASFIGDLIWDHVDFGPTLEAADYGTPFLTHPYAAGVLGASPAVGWKSSSVALSLWDDWQNRGTRGNRSEFVVRFTNDAINDGAAHYAYFYACNTAMMANRPYLAVTYEFR